MTDDGNRWTDEAERLTEGMPEGPQTDELRRAIRGNVELLSQWRAPAAPDGLWSRVQHAVAAEPPTVPMPDVRRRASTRLWAAALAAGLAIAAGLAWYLTRTGDPNRTTPDTAEASRAPTAAQVLAALAESLRSTGFEGTAVVEEFPVDPAASAPIRRELRVAFDGAAGNWRLTPTDAAGREIIRNGGRQFVRQPGVEGKAEWTVGVADDLPRLAPDGLTLDAAAVSANYAVALEGVESVAGRECRVLSVQARAAGRPGLKLWVDASTGMRLKSERADGAGRLVARTTFREFRPVADFGPVSPFEPPVSVSNDGSARPPTDFVAERDRARLGFVPFAPAQLPAGFALRRSVLLSPATGLPTLRNTYSDGLAVFEIYQQASAGGRDAGPTYRRIGRFGEVALERGGVSITVGGETDRALLESAAAALTR
jgi:negative regulator of sigma E activity